MSKTSFLLDEALPRLVIGMVLANPILLFLLLFWIDVAGVFGEPPCVTEVHDRLPGLSGFDFEISETGCSTLAKDLGVNVLPPGPENARRRFFSSMFPALPAHIPPSLRLTEIPYGPDDEC